MVWCSERAEFPILLMHICFLALLSFAVPWARCRVHRWLESLLESPQCVGKAMRITSLHQTAQKCRVWRFLLLFQQLKFGKDYKLKRYFAFLIVVFSVPFNPISSCELNDEPFSLSVTSLCRCRLFYYPIYILKPQNLSRGNLYTPG